MAAIEYTTKDFVQLVQSMRSAQKEYFANRGTAAGKFALSKSIELEQQVDHYAAKMEAKLKERGMW